MDKPEFLTGEVKSFEEVIKCTIISKPSKIAGAFSIEKNITIHDEWGLILFYSQPFTPSLITELFELKKRRLKSYETGVCFIIENYEIHFYSDFYIICTGGRVQIMNNPTPQTLNDFIRDCQRAGIDLKWK